MKPAEADQLTERIVRTWRNGVPAETWHEVLLPLHYGPAENAWRQLRDTHEHAPSIATFRNTYNAQIGTHTEPRTHCETCGGDGFKTIRETHHEHEYETLIACHCPNGNRVRVTLHRIRQHNDTELTRLGLDDNTKGTRPPQGHYWEAL